MKQGVPPLLEDSTLKEVANKYNKTVAQVILRYLVSSLEGKFSLRYFEMDGTFVV